MDASIHEHRLFGLGLLPQVAIGLVLGIGAGIWLDHRHDHETAEAVKMLGTVFLNLIKMLVIPLIFLALVSGVTSIGDTASFTRIGLKGLGAYLLTSMTAAAIGIGAGILFQPGVGLQAIAVDPAAAPAVSTMKAPPSIGQFFLDLIPTNIFHAMADDRFLQVIVFAVFFGAAINALGDKAARARDVIQEVAKIVFKMIEWVVRLAPLAVFGFMAWSIGTQGVGVIATLARLVLTVFAACGVQYLLFGVLILVFGRISPMPFYRKMLGTQMVAFSTSSSKATLTTAMAELENKMGVSTATTNFMMPLGACINMAGTAIYLGICAMFFSQHYGHPLVPHDYVVLVLTSTLGSIGAAGIPSGSIIFMGMVLNSVGLPIEGIGLILGVDRMLDMVRTTINITGDAAITLVIDRSEGTLDEAVYHGRGT